ncbi:hypothetical protein J6590_092458 [Homalodisca vitripennis]|nr:hypothetical protein J6590_092458 [Homalodisca vitripennis]
MAISNHLVENVVSKESRVEESAEVKLSSAPEDGLVNNGTSTSRLTVFHQNVDRMGNKIERLNHNVDSIKLDIVVLTEHVRNDNSISNVNLINYRFVVTSYSREFHRKGGIAIFARDSFGSQLEVINTHTQPGVNMRSCSYQDLYWQSKIFIHFWCSLYRPPGATLEEALTNGSQALELLPSRDEAWLQLKSLPASKRTLGTPEYTDSLCSLQGSPPHIALQLIWCAPTWTMTSFQWRSTNHPKYPVRNQNPTSKHSPTFQSGKYELTKKTLQNQSWDEIIQEENTEAAYSKTRSRSANRKSAILNAEAHNLKKKFVKAQDRYILSGRQEDKADAARKKKDYDLKLRQLRQQANENVTAEVINSERAQKNKQVKTEWILDTTNEPVSDITYIVKSLNSHFINIGEDTLKSTNGLQHWTPPTQENQKANLTLFP